MMMMTWVALVPVQTTMKVIKKEAKQVSGLEVTVHILLVLHLQKLVSLQKVRCLRKKTQANYNTLLSQISSRTKKNNSHRTRQTKITQQLTKTITASIRMKKRRTLLLKLKLELAVCKEAKYGICWSRICRRRPWYPEELLNSWRAQRLPCSQWTTIKTLKRNLYSPAVLKLIP